MIIKDNMGSFWEAQLSCMLFVCSKLVTIFVSSFVLVQSDIHSSKSVGPVFSNMLLCVILPEVPTTICNVTPP